MRFFRVKSGLGAAELCDALGRLDAIAVRCGAVSSEEEFRLAHYLAGRSSASRTNIAKKPAYEFMLWLAGKTDISSAIRELSPKEGEREFFLVVFSGAGEAEARRALGAGCRVLETGLPARGEPLALERISLSRI